MQGLLDSALERAKKEDMLWSGDWPQKPEKMWPDGLYELRLRQLAAMTGSDENGENDPNTERNLLALLHLAYAAKQASEVEIEQLKMALRAKHPSRAEIIRKTFGERP